MSNSISTAAYLRSLVNGYESLSPQPASTPTLGSSLISNTPNDSFQYPFIFNFSNNNNNNNIQSTMTSSGALSPSFTLNTSSSPSVVNISTVSSPINNTRPLKLRRPNHNDELAGGLSKLLRSESMTDVTLICKGGQTVRAHRVVLSTFSPYFRNIFEAQPFVSNPCQYPVIVIKDLELSELRAIVDYIYRGEVSVSREKLPYVLQAARALEVNGLSEMKLDNLIGQNSLLAGTSSDLLTDRPLQISVTSANNNNKRSTSNTIEVELNSAKKTKIESDTNDLIMLNINSSNSGSSLLQSQSTSDDQLRRQQLQSQQQLNQIVESFRKRNQQLSVLQQRQQVNRNQIQNRIQINQLKKQMYDLNQSLLDPSQSSSSLSNNNNNSTSTVGTVRKGGPRVSQIQTNQLIQFQQRLRQQMQDKQREIELKKAAAAFLAAGGGSYVSSGNEDTSSPTNLTKNDDENSQTDEKNDDLNDEMNEERPASQANSDGNCVEDCCDVVETQLVIDDENNNSIATNGENLNLNANNQSLIKNELGESKSEEEPDSANGEQPSDLVQTHLLPPDEEDLYEMDIDKDAIFQRQQQVRLEQLQKQQHFKEQFQLLHVSEAEQRMFELQEQLQRVASSVSNGSLSNVFNANSSLQSSSSALSAAAVELLESLGLNANGLSNNGNGNGNGRRGSLATSSGGGKDSVTQNSIASGSEDTDNDANTLDNLQDSFYDEYSNLSNKSPLPIQVKLDPQVTTVTQTPDFLLPRGPGRPRKGNKSGDISPCPECNKVFVRPDVLKLHFRSVHLNERHPCNMCPKIFKWPGDLSKHKRTKHPEAFPPPNTSANSLNSMLAIN